MNPRNTFILTALAAGLFAFIFFYERHLHPPVPPPPRVLAGLKPAEVTSVEVQPAGELAIRAERTNGNWQLTRPLAYPAQKQYVEGLLQVLADLSYQAQISAEALKDRPKAGEEFGFDAPLFTIRLEQDNPLTLKVGRFTAPGNQVYVQVVGRDAVDITAVDFLKYVPRHTNDWRDTRFVNLATGRAFDRVSVTNGAKFFELQRDSASQLWKMTWPFAARADHPKIEELLYRLLNLHVSRFDTDDPRADLEPLGLQPPQCELSLAQGTNVLVSLQFGKSPTNDSSLVYARIKGQNTVVLVQRDQVEAWRSDHERFRDPRLAGFFSGPLDVIEVRGTNGNFTAQRVTNELWQITDEMLKASFPADTNRMHDFIVDLSGLEIASSPGKFAVNDAVIEANLPTYGLAAPARKYVLKRSVAPAGGDPTNQVVAEMDFGSEADGKVYARRGDRPEESSVYAVKLEDYQRLVSNGLALRERRIWRFSEDNVSWIAVRQKGVSRKLVRRAANEWSLSVDSQGIIDKAEEFTTEAAASELGELEAENWVACGDQARAQHGFSEDDTRISVGLNGDQPEVLMLELGGWSSSKQRYAAVQAADGQSWIFELPAKSYERLAYDLKLRDAAVP